MIEQSYYVLLFITKYSSIWQLLETTHHKTIPLKFEGTCTILLTMSKIRNEYNIIIGNHLVAWVKRGSKATLPSPILPHSIYIYIYIYIGLTPIRENPLLQLYI